MKLSEIISSPTYPIVIPSSKKTTTYRPFTVKEEKALLAAQESEDQIVMLSTLDQVVRSCVMNCPSDLKQYDLEYLFTLIRAKSVGETSDLIMRCNVCNDPKARMKLTIDLRNVKIQTPDSHNKTISFDDNTVLEMKDPTVQELIEISQLMDREVMEIQTMKACISKIFYKDLVFDIREESDDEISKFFSNLNSKQNMLLEEYVKTIPYAMIDTQYKCSVCGHDHKTELKGIANFF